MAKPTWDARERRLLDAVAAAEEDGAEPNAQDLGPATGLPAAEVQRGLRALYDAEFITGIVATAQSDIFDIMSIRLLERGRVTVGQWPSDDAYDALVAVLDEQIAAAKTGEERSKLERLRDLAGELGKGMVASILNAWARTILGPPM